MGGLRRAGECQHVLDLLKVMPTKGVTPNNYTYRAALLACAQVNFGFVVLGLNTALNAFHTRLICSRLHFVVTILQLAASGPSVVSRVTPPFLPGTHLGLLAWMGLATTIARQMLSGFANSRFRAFCQVLGPGKL